tara:strand:- start:696 stop:1274 length:579 start_codon:yes stop_codon:yes gene_type:complete
MDVRPCNIVGTGVNGNIRREDLISGLIGSYLDKKYEKKFRQFTDDSLFTKNLYRYKKTKEFYTHSQMIIRLDEFKKQFITEQTKNHICMIRMIQEESGIRSNNAENYIKELENYDYYKHDKECREEKGNYHMIKHKKLAPHLVDKCYKVKIYLPELYETRNLDLTNTYFGMGLSSYRVNRIGYGYRYYCFLK